VNPNAPKFQLPPVGLHAVRSGPALTVVLACAIAAFAASAYAVPAPALFLLISVVYAAALGGWKGGLASALVALLYLGWLLTDAGRAAQYRPLNETLLMIGGLALPLALGAGWVLHRGLQRERGRAWDRTALAAFQAGSEESRAAGDRRFRTLVEQVRDYAIFMADPQGRPTTWNEGVKRLLGYEEHEFLGQEVDALFTPEDRARGIPQLEFRTAADEGCASDDRWLVRKDGSRFWAEGITTRLNDPSGQLLGFSKVFRDLTQEKEAQDRLRDSQERLRVALVAARMGIWRLHLPTNTQRLDGSMARLLGLGEAEVVESYELFREHIHPEDRAQVDAAFAGVSKNGGEMHVEFRVIRPDGSIRWLLDHGVAVRDASGTVEYLTGAAVDVTERRIAEERLGEAQRMDAVGRLAGGVAHEINNMMTVILGFSAMLLDTPDSPHEAELRQIHRAADRAAAITTQLLAFGRRQLLRPQVLDVNQLIRGLEPMLRRVLGEDKEFEAQLADDPGRVRADPRQLEQVLLNLTLNARDAMPNGGKFAISTQRVTLPRREAARPLGDELSPGDYVRLTISDTGHGMDAATAARVFEPFFTTKPVGEGTGLGLATAFGIVRQSGGTVRLFSNPGEGTTFHIYLPQVPDDAPLPVSERALPREVHGSGTVLVVEDEDMVRDFTCRVLAAHGYRCVEATDGSEALRLIRERGESIDAVVTDVVMPNIGGGTLARHLAEVRPGLPVLFTSAYTSQEVIRRGLISSDAPFLQKPFASEALLAKLREIRASPSAGAGKTHQVPGT
jgi:two-component system cell cycle sensor histidine kinase/response regulator CckA